jgi:hypothetical protein
MPPVFLRPLKKLFFAGRPLLAKDMPAEPCRLEKCRSSRAEVKTADRLACQVLAGSRSGADDFFVRAGH